jgi:hypothetical protein
MVSRKEGNIAVPACRALLMLLILVTFPKPSSAATGDCSSPVDRNDRPFGTYSDSDGSATCPSAGGGSFGGALSRDVRPEEVIRTRETWHPPSNGLARDERPTTTILLRPDQERARAWTHLVPLTLAWSACDSKLRLVRSEFLFWLVSL